MTDDQGCLGMSGSSLLVVPDNPAPFIRRLTLNRPEKRNALSNQLRSDLFRELIEADRDPGVRVMIIRGAGPCFSSGYDLNGMDEGAPWHTAANQGWWARHVVEGCFKMWDLAKPVIAQVHGWCLAGGAELAVSCDLVYVSHDARIGYPAVRTMAPPDNHYHPWLMGMRAAMEQLLTGDAISGDDAVRLGFANQAFGIAELNARVLEKAERIAIVDPELTQLNKRAVHRQMEAMGIRQGLRSGTDLHALGWHTPGSREFVRELQSGVTSALTQRDGAFGDYRTGKS